MPLLLNCKMDPLYMRLKSDICVTIELVQFDEHWLSDVDGYQSSYDYLAVDD
jgi:hypothetical protein